MSHRIRLFTAPRPVRIPQQLTWSSPIRQFTTRNGSFPEPAYSDEDYAAAREWAEKFKLDTLPRNLARTRFDRSSGKGGQHVNK